MQQLHSILKSTPTNRGHSGSTLHDHVAGKRSLHVYLAWKIFEKDD